MPVQIAARLPAGTATLQPQRIAAATGRLHSGVRLRERLAALRHHVRNRVDIERLIFVLYYATDVAHFDHGFAVYLALNSKVELVGLVGPEIPIQGLASTCCDGVESRKVRLRKCCGGGWNWRSHTIRANAESVGWQ